MFKIYDGREHFYQWDLDRKLIVEDPSITEVHFCNRTGDCSLVCETFVEDGVTLVNVPNILLQTDWRIHVYAYDGKHTKHDKCYEVKSRTKPADYVYTETEVKSWETLEKRIDAAEKEIDEIWGYDLPNISMFVSKMVTQDIPDLQENKADKADYESFKDVTSNIITHIMNTEIPQLKASKADKEYVDEKDALLGAQAEANRTSIGIANAMIDNTNKIVLQLSETKADTTYVDEQIGDIETALDEIINLQEELLVADGNEVAY